VTIPDTVNGLALHVAQKQELRERAFETVARMTARPRKWNGTHAHIIESAGGQYVAGMLGDLVLFNSPATGSTLALREADLTPDAVRAHIAESNAKFGVRS